MPRCSKMFQARQLRQLRPVVCETIPRFLFCLPAEFLVSRPSSFFLHILTPILLAFVFAHLRDSASLDVCCR